jgi:DNA repair exonuclease SbcCD ATPase subunit
MKIVKLRSENFLRLKAVEITPDGNVVVISGANEAGKTSVLDSIYVALTGKVPQKPIREGQEKAEITIQTEKYLISKTIKRKKGGGFNAYLKITGPGEENIDKPQTLLNNLLGHLAFDPLGFARLDEKEKKKILLDVLNINTDEIDEKRKKISEDRTIIGREVKNLAGEVAGMVVNIPADLPEKEIEQSEILEKIEKLQNELDTRRAKETVLEDRIGDSVRIDERIDEYEKMLSDLKEKKEKTQKSRADILKELQTIRKQDAIIDDIESSKELLKTAEETNILIRGKKKKEAAENSLKAKEREYNDITAEIAGIDGQKRKMIESAKMPINGLSFDEDGVLFKNIPFKQLSSSEQLKVSMAMAMSMNPELRIIRITDGSLLDKKSMGVIEEMAKKKDFQVWIEVVDESGERGIHIEAGEVKE